MARKFGKKNVIKVDPLAYNIGLIGESGIGKTTLAKEVCERLVGEDGYMILNIGKEDGIDAIPNASYEDIPDWETFIDFVDDILENRNTDYRDLKVLVYDTYDELMRITEPEVVRLHNKENPDKKVKSIKAAFGGFQAGEDKALELVLDKIWELKRVGISMFVLGHTKRKTLSDVATGLEYDMLTTNMSNKYFSGMKTKLHVLGIASVNRSIEQKSVKQKVGKDKIVGKVVDESRIITFRDDNFNIDSKSRFEDIVSYIPLDVDEFIKAIEDAIKVAHEKQKNKGSIEETKVKQEKEKEEAIDKAVEDSNKTKVIVKENEELADFIKEHFTSASSEIKEQIKGIMSEYGIKSLKDTEETPTQAFREIAELLK
ncbi:AAA family ATPase [Bacillus sp. S13(2024)]|uniref:AAA family ATPase n=1 Tax=Bacillus sp. S13(2024) TaxID=3162885 RepID=UPI003D1D6241